MRTLDNFIINTPNRINQRKYIIYVYPLHSPRKILIYDVLHGVLSILKCVCVCVYDVHFIIL